MIINARTPAWRAAVVVMGAMVLAVWLALAAPLQAEALKRLYFSGWVAANTWKYYSGTLSIYYGSRAENGGNTTLEIIMSGSGSASGTDWVQLTRPNVGPIFTQCEWHYPVVGGSDLIYCYYLRT